MTTFQEQVIFAGGFLTANGQTARLPAGSVRNVDIEAGAGIAASKLQHPIRKTFAQANTAAAAETRIVHTVLGATATLQAFRAGSIAACTGNATITVDLKKNGTTVLSAVITLDNANTARVSEAAVLSVTALVAGDVLEVVVAVDAGTGGLGTGLFVEVSLYEDAV